MFFDKDPGMLIGEFGIWYFIPLIVIVSGVVLIYLFRKQLREFKHEKWIRYGLGTFAIIMEISLHLWNIGNGTWHFPESMPIGLCAFSLFLGIYVIFTKSWKVFEIAYFWALGGLVSVLFPDILFGPDRFRYYQFLLAHTVFFWIFMYMMFVHKYIPTNKSFKKSFILLLVLVVFVIIPINFWWGANFMYLASPGDTPFTIVANDIYVLYALGCIVFASIVITLWYSPIWIYHQIQKRKEIK